MEVRLHLEELESRMVPARLPPSLFTFDYSFDKTGFYTPQRQQVVYMAGAALSARLRPHLQAIVPDSGHHWTGYIADPSTGNPTTINDLTIPADKITVYMGIRDMPDTALASETPALASAGADNTDLAWLKTTTTRGASSTVTTPLGHTDPYGPWGGTIALSSVVSWSDGVSESQSSRTPPGFLSGTSPHLDIIGTVEHELGHLLGFGTSPAWFALSQSGSFTGKMAETVYGSAVPVDAGDAHWVTAIKYLGVDACMDYESIRGRRFTELDYAGLADIGWNVTGFPEGTVNITA